MFILFGVFAAACSFLLYWKAPPLLQQQDFRMKDARFRIRGPVKPDKDVAVIAIDHKSIKELGRWPWSREVTAKLIEKLASDYGTKVTALDIVFSETQNPVADEILASSISKAGNVVLGYFFRDEPSELSADSLLQLEDSKIRLLKNNSLSPTLPILEYPGIDLNMPRLSNCGLGSGFFNARPDVDGLYRSSILILQYNGNIYQSLSIKALSHYLDQEVLLDVKEWGVDSLRIGGMRIPSREDGTMMLNYYGRTGTFLTVSASDIISGRAPKDSLKGKIAIVGATEIGIYDLRPTPFDATLPGVEIHATIIANALERRFLKYDVVTQMIEIICIWVFPILLGTALSFVPGTFAGLAISGIITSAFCLLNYAIFSLAFRDMTILYPLIGTTITYLGGEAWRNIVVERKGRQLKKAFSSYVSPDLVKQIEKNPELLVLGGEQRELSILFSDIRGFTAFSETLKPPELVKFLNSFMNPMTRSVLEEKGTLDKFIGDAVMALFNAPLDVPDHAVRACASALKMLDEIGKLNAHYETIGMRKMEIGIGINTGPAIVGNMGADIRFDYTAIGDSVNLASRLEGLNKYYSTRVLVSEFTRSQIKDKCFTFREIDRVMVKGKSVPVTIFELVTEDSDILHLFEDGLSKYRKMDFSGAREVFSRLVSTSGDGPSAVYVKRCEEFMAAPPSEGWQAIHVINDK